MRVLLRTLFFGLFAASATASILAIRKMLPIIPALKSGTLSPQDAIAQLKGQDPTGALSQLLEAQQAQLKRLQDPLGEEGAPGRPLAPAAPRITPPATPPSPMRLFDTNSDRRRTGAAGRGVLIDSQGRRFEITSRPAPPPERTSLSGAGRPSKNRAYGALLGTAAAAFLLLLWVRRRFKV
jgi:hypothetical protein